MDHRIRAAVSIGGRDTPKISVIADIPTEAVVYQNMEHERAGCNSQPSMDYTKDFYEGIMTSAQRLRITTLAMQL
jgi:hypothetical protein